MGKASSIQASKGREWVNPVINQEFTPELIVNVIGIPSWNTGIIKSGNQDLE
jgi:hypothetical protein|tara:strand:- start:16597 stop:16752 length:156 start_codon:yes stop_codon:yes gene_type:complete